MRAATTLLVAVLGGCSTADMQAFDERYRNASLANQAAPNPQLELIQQRQAQRRAAGAQQTAPEQPTGTQASWTGRSQSGQSVSGSYGMYCEYTYAGKFFWRMYQSSCPSSVTVQ